LSLILKNTPLTPAYRQAGFPSPHRGEGRSGEKGGFVECGFLIAECGIKLKRRLLL